MKRIVQFLAPALLLTVAAAPARSLNITAGLATALRLAWGSGFSPRSGLENGESGLKRELHAPSDAVDASRAHTNRAPFLSRADFVISKFDKRTVEAFGRAWRRSGNGSLPREGVVLILQMADGGHSSRDMGSTNEHRQFTFRWHPATIAIVHTHPNSSDPRPQDEDLVVADKYRVPIFTITNRGMHVYDPRTKKVSKVMSNLDWLDISNGVKGCMQDSKLSSGRTVDFSDCRISARIQPALEIETLSGSRRNNEAP